jgi:hypothetical protein
MAEDARRHTTDDASSGVPSAGRMTAPNSPSRGGLPAGPGEPPILQTLHWLLRPISFLERSRRRFGDTFSVRFLGLGQPMVMVSDPDAIRDLFGNPEHGVASIRTLALLPGPQATSSERAATSGPSLLCCGGDCLSCLEAAARSAAGLSQADRRGGRSYMCRPSGRSYMELQAFRGAIHGHPRSSLPERKRTTWP